MSYLSECSADEAVKVMAAASVVKQNKLHRRYNRESRNGYDRGKSMRHILSFHPSVLFHPEFSKYFDSSMDPKERKKSVYAFARKFPQYVVVDKL